MIRCTSTYAGIPHILILRRSWNVASCGILRYKNTLQYLTNTMDERTNCWATSKPIPTRKVSLSSLDRQLNIVVCIDHFHLDLNRVLHLMDSYARFSAGDVVDSMSMSTEISLFETLWVTPFWTPDTVVLFDPAFDNTEFTAYLNGHGIQA